MTRSRKRETAALQARPWHATRAPGRCRRRRRCSPACRRLCADRPPAASRKSSSPRRSARRTCRTCRSASRPSARERLDELQVQQFDDYVQVPAERLLPDGAARASRHVYMRGVASGENGNHSGPLPSVGIYLDEQPITTIQGALDVHLYDIERVEALAGPQGTLYGASSQAGTIRIITNKPDPSGFDAGYGLEVQHGRRRRRGLPGRGLRQPADQRPHGGPPGRLGVGTTPATSTTSPRRAPTRLVGHHGPPTTATAPVEDDYNDVDTYGARAALQLDLNDNWTITPQLMAPEAEERTAASPTTRPSASCKVAHVLSRERRSDRWMQAALTVEGKIAQLRPDLRRRLPEARRRQRVRLLRLLLLLRHAAAATATYWLRRRRRPDRHPSQYIQGKDSYDAQTHELRIWSPAEQALPLRRWARSTSSRTHNIEQRYKIDGLG